MAKINGLKHTKFVYVKWHFWKFLWTVCSTTWSTVECVITWMMSTEVRCSRRLVETARLILSPLYWFKLKEYVWAEWIRAYWLLSAWCYSTLPIGIFKSAAICERVLRVSDHLSRLFLTRFPRTRCYIKGTVSCWQQVYFRIIHSSLVLDIFTRLILETAKKLIIPSVVPFLRIFYPIFHNFWLLAKQMLCLSLENTTIPMHV